MDLKHDFRNRFIEKREIDVLIFGEYQALLHNYENLVIELFGDEYALNEALVYSLQFSQLRTPQQDKASKVALSKGIKDLFGFVKTYRDSLSDDDYASQEYSIKLIQIPEIANTSG